MQNKAAAQLLPHPHLSWSIPGATGDPPQLGGPRAGSPSLLPPPSALAAASGQGPCCVPQAGTKHSLELPLRHPWHGQRNREDAAGKEVWGTEQETKADQETGPHLLIPTFAFRNRPRR